MLGLGRRVHETTRQPRHAPALPHRFEEDLLEVQLGPSRLPGARGRGRIDREQGDAVRSWAARHRSDDVARPQRPTLAAPDAQRVSPTRTLAVPSGAAAAGPRLSTSRISRGTRAGRHRSPYVAHDLEPGGRARLLELRRRELRPIPRTLVVNGMSTFFMGVQRWNVCARHDLRRPPRRRAILAQQRHRVAEVLEQALGGTTSMDWSRNGIRASACTSMTGTPCASACFFTSASEAGEIVEHDPSRPCAQARSVAARAGADLHDDLALHGTVGDRFTHGRPPVSGCPDVGHGPSVRLPVFQAWMRATVRPRCPYFAPCSRFLRGTAAVRRSECASSRRRRPYSSRTCSIGSARRPKAGSPRAGRRRAAEADARDVHEVAAVRHAPRPSGRACTSRTRRRARTCRDGRGAR